MTSYQKKTYDPTTGQVIALSGLVQSAYLVSLIAKLGQAPTESINPSINSLFQFDAQTPEQVFGGIHGIQLGLRVLHDILSNSTVGEYRETIRYTVGILYLQKKLIANTDMLSIIRTRLDHTALKASHFTNDINEVSASVAAIYQDTISTIRYRIQVTGSMQQLQNPININNIRALLLAGIRAAILWRQTGGRRWQLLFSRKLLQQTAQQILES